MFKPGGGLTFALTKIEERHSKLTTPNSSILTLETLDSLGRLFQGGFRITPIEFYAFSALSEAAVLHEKVYFIGRVSDLPRYLDSLAEEGILVPLDENDLFNELRLRNEDALGGTILQCSQLFRHHSGGLDRIEALLTLERHMGLASLAEIGSTPDSEIFSIVANEDLEALAYELNLARDLHAAASVLDLEYYPSLESLPFLLSVLAEYRNPSLQLYQRISEEFSEFLPTDGSFWRRQPIPVIGQVVLATCVESQVDLTTALLTVRGRLARFREFLSETSVRCTGMRTLGEQRRLRLELNVAWEALVKRESTVSSRVVYSLWSLFKNPLRAVQAAGDMLIEKDRLNQAIGRVGGLTDVWHLFADTSIVDSNARLLSEAVGNRVEERSWAIASRVGYEFNSLLTKLSRIKNP